MDVKTNLASSSTKGTTANKNKDQDVNDEYYPKTLHKREPNGTKKNVQSTKCNIQKTKDFVKRQKLKRQYHGSAEKNSKVVMNKLPEQDSVLVQKSKGVKENGNHLLNFRYARDVGRSRDVRIQDTARYSHKNDRLLSSMQQHKYNKEQFVQYSCQFVVSAYGDYSLHLTNPDILVDWKLIEQIKFYSSESSSCPICLSTPVAGKITRCGHIYCWHCILCYINVNDCNSCKCPICYEYVHKNDLKSVSVITRSTFALGDIVNLRLMRRERNSLFATPVESTIQPPTTFLSVSENAVNGIYSKLLIANIKDTLDIIEHERLELEDEFHKSPEMFEYIEQALNELSKRKEKLQWKSVESKNILPMENVTKMVDKTLDDENEKNYEKKVNGCYKDTTFLSKLSSDNASNDNQLSSNSSKFYYFYQAEDGQYLYLHAVNVKMLEMQYNNLKNCPLIITGKIVEKEANIFTEDLRRRLRYLCHLPLNSPFEQVEIELKPPLVSTEVLHVFNEQLNSRRKRREQKKREEKKREEKIMEKENRLLGIYPTPNIDIKSYQEFPQWQPEHQFKDYIPLSLESASSSTIDSPSYFSVCDFKTVSSNTALSTLDEITLKQETENSQKQNLTFAAILTRNKSANAWPSIKSKQSNSISTSSNKNEEILTMRTYNKFTNIWPSVKSDQCFGTTSSNEDEKEINVSEQKSQFLDMTQNKLPKSETKDNGCNNGCNTVGNKKKKKKGKGIVLFKTGMTSGYSL